MGRILNPAAGRPTVAEEKKQGVHGNRGRSQDTLNNWGRKKRETNAELEREMKRVIHWENRGGVPGSKRQKVKRKKRKLYSVPEER